MLVIDADPGIGDALAIALALSDPDLDVVGITACAGCVSGRQAARNIQALVDLIDPPRRPRIGVSHMVAPLIDSPLVYEAPGPQSLNGANGLGDLELRAAELHHAHVSAKVLADLVRQFPHRITLLTLGPLTNVALAQELEPQFFELLRELVCLGGSFQIGGDITAAAEFNILVDPESAAAVFARPATKTIVPRDVAERPEITFERLNAIQARRANNPLWRLANELLPFALRAHHEELGREGFPLKEVTALAAIARPGLFERDSLPVDVELRGEITRGMTVFDIRPRIARQPNADVVIDVDEQGVLDYFQRFLFR
ncbi:MAG: nucleoside hydrolase [Planctomycetota bacterium]|nr:MAG: nucleoside hydrolase [Planctomycetota bacterium]